MKRIIDLVIASLSLVLFMPALIFIYLQIRIRLGSPVFFIQQRPGLRGSPFNLIKFRSMRDETDATGKLLSDEQRMTPFGSFLRSTSLDELPELINVLRGDMSIVGPRPLLMEYLPLYNKEQARRHEVRPGITGWAQVNGRNSLDWPERLKMDVYYVDNHNLGLDLKIILMTVKQVLSRQGVSEEGHVTMSKFRGNNDE
ncbi:MAG: sugar transferase [Desulfobulbaceae bacterium]|nr:MAG: sugar transferase [Desulfobulbaceae bacterium]